MKSRRNDPCWCGAGLKYKKCHINRDQEVKVNIQDILKESKKAKFKKCFHPEANSSICNHIIKAHSIQKSKILRSIAKDGHLYNFKPELNNFIKNSKVEPELIGINDASTFTGFCNYHDTNTFSPIELNDIQINNEHIFLIAYRSLCKELYAKTFQKNMIPLNRTLDKGFDEKAQRLMQEFLSTYEKGVTAGLNDINEYKKIFDNKLLANNFDGIIFYVIETEEIPEIVASGQIYVEIDFNGNILQTEEEILDFNNKLDRITLSVLSNNNKGLVVFSCFKDEKRSIEFLKSVERLTNEDLPDSIIRFVFEYFENVFISPNWWDSLTTKVKEAIITRMNNSIILFIKRDKNVLKNDGYKYVRWKVLNRYKNF